MVTDVRTQCVVTRAIGKRGAASCSSRRSLAENTPPQTRFIRKAAEPGSAAFLTDGRVALTRVVHQRRELSAIEIVRSVITIGDFLLNGGGQARFGRCLA